MAKPATVDRKFREVTERKSLTTTRPHSRIQNDYSRFDQLDGSHPWQKANPEACVMYDVRILPGGKVAYFNFDLAKEMGLVHRDHPAQLNKFLEEKLLETFCIRIINEWDEANNITFPKTVLKKNKYMATRYLQLQHQDKTGRTSGDGRSIWNGVVEYRGRTWDVSSRGTGVTRLAPGVVQAGRPLRSGNTDHGYGCGMAEMDELYAAAIMAEVMHNQGFPTERVLAIIDLGQGMGIGVRACDNLMRPAHLFAMLKQNQHESLTRAVDYLIDRQSQNDVWPPALHKKRRYDVMLERLVDSFARFAAHLDREYVFAWLDWDGDNVLINSGIIDYGSVRQFGLRHDQYRYDDVERYSTNLNEQKNKTRVMVQTFAQMVDYLKSGKKRQLRYYRNHLAVRNFDKLFDLYTLEHFLYQVGLSSQQRHFLLNRHKRIVWQFFQKFSALERTKTARRISRVADGINRPAILNMRQFLSEVPKIYLAHLDEYSRYKIKASDLYKLILADSARGKDRKLRPHLKRKIEELQVSYKRLIAVTAGSGPIGELLYQLSEVAPRKNRQDRITGNALIYLVDELLKSRRRGFSDSSIQLMIDLLIDCQKKGIGAGSTNHLSEENQKLWSQLLEIIENQREEI